jgi:hypothetical protein
MALVDDIKVSLGISTDRRDAEVQLFIDAALAELERVGIDPAILDPDTLESEEGNALVKHAVIAYCKAHRGQDTPNIEFYDDSFRRIAIGLANSSANIAAKEEA